MAAARRPIFIAASAGLILRLAWLALAQPEPVSDFEYYRRLAVSLLDAHQLGEWRPSAFRVPGYPMFLAGAMLVSRSVVWLSIANVLVSTALIPVVEWLADALTGRRTIATAAAWIVALDPTFVFFAPVLASEHLFALLLLSSLVALLARVPIIAGLLYGAAILTRPDGLFYAPVFGFVALTVTSGRGWARWRPLVLSLTIAIVLLVPWLVRNRLSVGPGAGLTTIGGLNFYYAHNDRHYGWHLLDGTPLYGLGEIELDRRAYALGFDHIRREGLSGLAVNAFRATPQLYSPRSSPFALYWSTRKAGTTPDNSVEGSVPGQRVWRLLMAGYALILLAAILSLLFVRRLPARATIVLGGIVFCNWVAYCWISWADPRHRYVAELVFCALAAVTVIEIVSRVRPRRIVPAPKESAVP